MSKDYSNLYLSTIKHDTLTNKGKINDLESLWFHYSHLLEHFIKDMNRNFIKGNGIPKFTNTKPYQDDIAVLYNRATKSYYKKIGTEEEVHKSLESILQDIADNAIKTPLSARYVQCCYSQAYETYASWTALLSNKIKEYLGSSSVNDELVDGQPLLTTCYRINKYKLWYHKPALRWAYGDNGELVVPTKKNKAQVELIVPDTIMKFMKRLVKQARKLMSLPNLSKVRVLKLDEKVATLEVTKNTHHVNYWLKLSTLDKGKPVYIPLKNNPYYAKLLETGERLPFVQIGLKENKLTVSPILAHRKAEFREDSNELGLDFGMVTMFTTSTGERHGITTFTKLKIWDDLLLTRTKELQAKKIRLSSDPYYKSLQSRIRSFMKNEIGRIFNKLANKGYGIFVVEKLDFRYSKLSKRMNRLLTRTYRKVIKEKLVRLKEKCGITTVEVNPAFTSQECSNCGFVSKENRKSQSVFKCTCCHYSINADINAARNIIKRRSFDNELRKYAREHKVRITRCLILEKLSQRHCHEKQLSSELPFIGCQP